MQISFSCDRELITAVMGIMEHIPNVDILRNMIHKIDEEYDLENRLKRYENQSELIKMASKQDLQDLNEAVRVLFTSDFIVTASEVPPGGTDDDRYRSVISSFLEGRVRCSSFDNLMRIFYLAYKTAILIRRQDLFMAGRGLPRKTALIRLKDSYIIPYLAVASEVLEPGPCGWELGILSAALKRMYPDQEIQYFKGIVPYTDHKTLVPFIWELLESYSQKQTVETNPQATISNVKNSQSILLPDSSHISMLSLWNFDLVEVPKLEAPIKSLVQFLGQSLDGNDLISIKGSTFDTMDHFFIVRDPFIPSKPIFITKTPADDLNMSKVTTILHLRGEERNSWKSVLTPTDHPIERAKEKSIEKPKAIATVKPSETIVVTDEEKKETLPLKEGFFGKLKRKLFGTKKQPQAVPVSEKVERRKILKEEKPRKKEKKHLQLFTANSSFIAHGITVDAVSDLDLFELFDTIREESYYVVGTFETDFKKTSIVFLTKQAKELPSTIVSFFNELDHVMSELFKTCFDEHQILLEELFFMSNDGQKHIISLNGNQDRVVGTIARSFVEKIVDWHAREKEQEPLQRRSLHMRTKQFLAARRHTAFDEAVERIYGSNFVKAAESITLDQPIFSLR